MSNPNVLIETPMGEMLVELWPDKAPETVANFLAYVDEEFYDGLIFHRVIKGTGARYCPSIEDKVARFPHRERHQIFLEPEGLNSAEVYANGIPTSLPLDVQLDMRSFPCTMPCSLRAIPFRPRQRLRSWAAWKRKSACPSAPWPKAPSKSSLKCCASRTSSSLAAADMTKPPNLSGSGAFAFSLQQKSDIRRGLLGQLYRLPHHQPHRPRLHAWRKPMMCRTRSQPYRLTGHRQ